MKNTGKRKLIHLEKEELDANDGNRLKAPAVLVRSLEGEEDENSAPSRRVIYGVFSPIRLPSVTMLGIGRADGTIERFKLSPADSLKVDESSGEISFSAYGYKYKIRAIQDSDSSWILGGGRRLKRIPAEQLEQMVGRTKEPEMEKR